MSERLVWKLKKQLKLVTVRKSGTGLSCVCSLTNKARYGSMLIFFQTTLSKDSFQVADEVVVLLLLFDLSYRDAEKPSVHHVDIAGHQT